MYSIPAGTCILGLLRNIKILPHGDSIHANAKLKRIDGDALPDGLARMAQLNYTQQPYSLSLRRMYVPRQTNDTDAPMQCMVVWSVGITIWMFLLRPANRSYPAWPCCLTFHSLLDSPSPPIGRATPSSPDYIVIHTR